MPSISAKPSLKLTVTNALLVVNAFVWYLLVFNTLDSITGQISPSTLSQFGLADTEALTVLVFGVNACSIAILAFIGSFAIDKLKKRTYFLNVWMLLGVIVSLVPLALDMSNIMAIVGISALFGAYFGIGMPIVMGYFSGNTVVANRAKLAGITFLLIAVFFSALGFFVISSILIAWLVLSGIRLAGFLFFRWSNVKEFPSEESKPSYRSIISNRGFLLFFISWLMLSLVNYMSAPIQQEVLKSSNETFAFLVLVLENIIIAVSAIICGFVADIFGRKRITIFGFVMLGIGYAILGLFPNWQLSSYLFIAADGVAWGIFNIVFLLIIWGDLAQSRSSDKFYFLGAMPYVFSSFLRLLFVHYVPEEVVRTLPIFSFASIFLFLAVLPLLYAPETLSEKLMKDRDLKSYVEKAKRKAQKESEKTSKEEKPNNDDQEKSQDPEDDEEYKEAMKLAEKYY